MPYSHFTDLQEIAKNSTYNAHAPHNKNIIMTDDQYPYKRHIENKRIEMSVTETAEDRGIRKKWFLESYYGDIIQIFKL